MGSAKLTSYHPHGVGLSHMPTAHQSSAPELDTGAQLK